jgi:hypothetical protein
MTLMADKPELEEGDVIKATLFDLPYWNEDIHEKPLSYRREQLEKFYNKYLKGDNHFALTNFIKVKSKDELEARLKQLARLPQSEGIMIKDLNSPWSTNGATNDWAKVKIELEAKVIVLEVHDVKGGAYNYTCGLLKGDSKYTNTTTYKDREYINLGKCFNTKLKANVGDILTVHIEEVIPQDDQLNWLGARVIDIDYDRKEPYFADQLVEVASRRGSVLQKLQAEEGETRGERAEEFWSGHWQECYPKSGKGKFIYHHHWRGLDEDEVKLSEDELLNTEHSVHGDLRCQYSSDYAWGFSVFLGKTSDVREADGFRLKNLKDGDKLQGDFKLKVPIEWLKVGIPKPYIAEPGSAGATEKTWAKFFAKDYGDYDMGIAREHAREIFLHGKELKGRFLIQYAPVGGKRVWLISKPEDQTPYAESNKLEDVIKELKQKNQKWLIWAKPGMKPELIDVSQYKIEKDWTVPIIKAEAERFVYGIVLQPNTEDAQGDVISKEEIAKASHAFMESCQQIGVQHTTVNPQIKIWESYLAPQDLTIGGQKVLEGSWLLGVHILDNEVWRQVEKGELTGFSIKGYGNRR